MSRDARRSLSDAGVDGCVRDGCESESWSCDISRVRSGVPVELRRKEDMCGMSNTIR